MSAEEIPPVQTRPVERRILYAGLRTAINSVLDRLEGAGWDLLFFSHMEEILPALDKALPAAGILAFDEKDLLHRSQEILHVIAQTPHLRWIALIPKESLAHLGVRQMIGNGFYDYHTTPVDAERLLVILGHAAGMAEISQEAAYITDAEESLHSEAEMVGSSIQMQAVYRSIRKVAETDAAVLITGESGTGKELAANAIHERSSRRNGPFVAVNCGALPESLIQSELFGHEKGSFTGAHERKIGRIESAHGGTLFLDEIGDLPLKLQVNLLRFLQDQSISRIGGREEIRVDVRILAATHVNLDDAIRAGSFRQDLYYRLNVLQIKMPPLREREGDIPLLAQYVYLRFADERGQRVRGFSEDAMQIMSAYSWPGNIRELINRVRRAMVMCEKILITAGDLGLERRRNSRVSVSLGEARDQAECDAIKSALAQNMGCVTRAAEQLQISRVSLYRLMEKHHISTGTQKMDSSSRKN